ncbi:MULTISPECIES: hypothetical protein [Streptomycetaceae]|uniref:Uncharacterized protein n=1 Tax=Streptantibioticus cattleyicolor (strain ATCC 35852 / DSM 46488 / JCM 4925 / NBRC 14057 / NRRL 8057) TaxID=1003195 RepID=G8X436_STREN|nr:hypothetical protein [Streptantibioticus cattleyicolor]AEW98031.1 hypothetical protein SCATT_56600 [Streptantibioticus cattleyicolor NRRL 8057 = DSM 46488]
MQENPADKDNRPMNALQLPLSTPPTQSPASAGAGRSRLGADGSGADSVAGSASVSGPRSGAIAETVPGMGPAMDTVSVAEAATHTVSYSGKDVGPDEGSDGSGTRAEIIDLFGTDSSMDAPGRTGGRDERSGDRSHRSRRTAARRLAPGLIGYGLIGCGVLLLPWLVVLATGLPSTATASHWATAWVGLDAFEALGLISTGVLAVRGDHRRTPVAVATATLLLVDAWFDTTTASVGSDIHSALVMAVGAEVPLAVLCIVLAFRGHPGRDAS